MVGLTASSAVVAPVPAFVGSVTSPALVVPAATLGGPTNQVEELSEPFQKDGPFGKKGESLSVSQLRSRSRQAFEEFAWNAISERTKKLYRFAWQHFVKFGIKISLDVNKFKWDFSVVCEFLVYR